MRLKHFLDSLIRKYLRLTTYYWLDIHFFIGSSNVSPNAPFVDAKYFLNVFLIFHSFFHFFGILLVFLRVEVYVLSIKWVLVCTLFGKRLFSMVPILTRSGATTTLDLDLELIIFDIIRSHSSIGSQILII